MSGESKEELDLKAKEVAQETEEELNNKIKEVEISEENNQNNNSQKTKKISSHQELVQKVDSTKEIAQNKYNEYLEADSNLNQTIEEFIKLENEIINTTVSTSLELLEKLNVDSLSEQQTVINEIEKDNKEELITIKRPSKGFGKGLFIGLIGAIATFGGAITYGAKLANLPLNSATLLQKANLDTIATKYSELLNIKGTVAGYVLVGTLSLLVGYILYKIVTAIQKSKNIKYAQKIEKDTEEYIANLDYKISKIDSLIEHIKNIKSVMQKYDIILQEQNAKIRRILFIEQPEDGLNSLQRASKLEVEKSVLILDELLKLMNTPVNESIEIREESKEELGNSNSLINEVIKKLYIIN